MKREHEEIETIIEKMDTKQCDYCKLGYDGENWRLDQPCPIQSTLLYLSELSNFEYLLEGLINFDTYECKMFKMMRTSFEIQKEKLF